MIFYHYYIIWAALNFNANFSANQPENITVYYEKNYKKEWFASFSNYPIKFVPFSHSSNYATQIIKLKDSEIKTYKIYLINTDLLYDIHGVKNYKIKGLSYTNRNLSVVTLKNMTDKNLIKVLKHEFSHGRGLSHCEHKDCIMNDAKGKFSKLKNCNEFKESCLTFIKKESKLKI
jgi:predicted Zn-dependent protease